MIKIRTCVSIISLAAMLMGFSRGQDRPDGKSVVTAAPPPKCGRAQCAPPPPLAWWCVPAPLAGPPPICPPPPFVYCHKALPRTNQVRVPDEVHAYAIGRLPRDGGMDEAHLYYRIEQSAHWDLRLPNKKQAAALTTGPREVFYPPTYSPPPRDQRVRDAVAAADQARLAAEEAQRNFQSAIEDIHKKLQEDNQLKEEIQDLLKQNQRLREQLEGEHAHPTPTASPSKSTVPRDRLKDWGDHLIQYNDPATTGTPSP